MGGRKGSIPIVKIENKDSRAVAFSKRRKGLFSKASELCLLSGAKIAILTTPISQDSNVSFYSFGHPSVDSVVSAFLANKLPREDDIIPSQGLGFCWEDESLVKSDDPVKLRAAIASISSTLQNLDQLVKSRGDGEKLKKRKTKKNVNLQKLDQTLSSRSNFCIQGDVHAKTDQTGAISDKNKTGSPENLDGCNQQQQDLDQLIDYETKFDAFSKQLEMDLDKNGVDQNQTLDLPLLTSSASICIQDDSPANSEGFNNAEHDQILAISNNNNDVLPGNLDEWDLDELIDYVTNFEGLSMDFEMDDDDFSMNQNPNSDSETVEDRGALVMSHGYLDNEELHLDQIFEFQTNPTSLFLMDNVSNQNLCSGYEDGGAMLMVNHRDLDEDNLKFSDYFKNLPSITTL